MSDSQPDDDDTPRLPAELEQMLRGLTGGELPPELASMMQGMGLDKVDTPIWKHQNLGDGSTEWVGLP